MIILIAVVVFCLVKKSNDKTRIGVGKPSEVTKVENLDGSKHALDPAKRFASDDDFGDVEMSGAENKAKKKKKNKKKNLLSADEHGTAEESADQSKQSFGRLR